VPAAQVREAATAAGGHATLYGGLDKRGGVFHPLAPTMRRIQRALMDSFDPDRVFDRARLYPDL
jgi:glycolate oxidase FAD binding subunit